MSRHTFILGVHFVVASLIGCGSSDHSSGDGGLGGDGTTGGSGEDGSGGSSGGASSGSSGGASSGASSGGASSSGGGGDGSSPPADGAAQADAGAYDPSVYQHHKNGTRNGVYIDPVLTSGTTGNAATMHVLSGFMGTMTTATYAQPLYVEKGVGGAETFIVATEGNHVTAINATTGATLWDQGPATYAPQATGGLPCGDINPLGITGTPFIDPASPINGGNGVIYFDAMTMPATGTFKHMVYAVKLSDGTVLPNWPVDVTAKVSGFTSGWQNQRGALQLVNGVLYVPYGGLDGDCPYNTPTYYGWVIGFPVSNPQTPTGWHTAAYKGGIWGPGSLPTDGTSVFPVTGNTYNANNVWGGGEAVIRLTAGPAFSNKTTDYYAPYNWQDLDNGDTDLGGASEVLFDMPGTSTPHLVAAGGKDGHLYLLNRDNLGGAAATQAADAALFNETMATNQFKGAPVAYTTAKGTYVAFHVEGGSGTGCPTAQGGNLVAIKITGGTGKPTASVAWCSISSDSNLASPIVTTTDGTSDAIVWAASDHLWGYDGDTGAKLFTDANTEMGATIQTWNTPIAIGKGRIAVAVNGQIYLFSAP
jgi:hypothetical protein